MKGVTRLAILLLLAAACTSSSSPSSFDGSTSSSPGAVAGTTECDPLSVAAAPITLDEIVGAGRAKDGTVYVVDRAATGRELRAFVSSGTALRRRVVAGAGESPDWVIVTVGDDLQIRIETTNGKPTRMGVFVGPPDPKTKSFEIGVQGEELTLLSASDLSTFTLVNTTNVGLMYAATTADGRYFISFYPDTLSPGSKSRVFFGPKDRVAQRAVLSESRDSTVHLEIDLDGVRTQSQLNFCLGTPFGATRLQAGGVVTPLTVMEGSPGDCAGVGDGAPPRRKEVAELVAGLRFYCF